MTDQPRTTMILPEELPVLTIEGVILPPTAHLSINVYQPHYLAMIDEILGKGRLFGVIQPTASEEPTKPLPPLYRVGCVGKITSFSETEDGRYLLDAVGICRFRLTEELPQRNGYRVVKPDWQPYLGDMSPSQTADFDRARLTSVLRTYFKTHGVSADWSVVQNTTSEELISSLAMICPLAPNEKQALLEAETFQARVELLITLLEMATLNLDDSETAKH